MARLLAAAAKSIAPPQRLTPSQWAEKNFYLSPEASSEPGRINFNRAPYQREMLDAIIDPTLEEVVIMSSSQVGKTTIQLAMVGFLIDLQPCPIMWLGPTLQMSEATSKDRLAPMLRDSPALSQKVKPPTARNSGNTLLSKAFPGGQIVLVGANSPASLASRPIRAILGDELDRFPDSAGSEGCPVNLAKKRTATFWNRLHIWVSTPTVKDKSRIEKLWNLSDKRHYLVPCPHCGHRQALAWEGLQYENKGKIDLTRGDVGEVTYRCSGCGKDIDENRKFDMLAAGQWEASGRAGKIAGFHLNELYSPWKPWQDVARDFEAAQGDPLRLQVFWNTSLGLPFEHDGATKFDWENLQYRADASDYQMGQIPSGVFLLTAGVDIQGDRLECSIFGWGEGEQCWLIRHEVLFGDPLDNGVWEDLDFLLQYDFSHPLGGTLRVRKTAIDSGYLAQEVYRRSRGRKDWMVIKGVAGDRKLVGAGTWQEINWQNKPIKRGIKVHSLGVDLLKQTILGRCRVAAPGPKYLNLPNNLPPKYCQELAGSEVMIKKKVNASWKYVWEPVPGVRNEPLDCAVYAYAAAIFLGLPRFNANHWDKIRQSITNETGQPVEPETPKPESPPTPEPPKRRKPVRRINNYLSGFGRGF